MQEYIDKWLEASGNLAEKSAELGAKLQEIDWAVQGDDIVEAALVKHADLGAMIDGALGLVNQAFEAVDRAF